MNNEKNINDVLRIGRNDQAQAAMNDLAASMSAYYAALKENGVPEDVAEKLVVEFQRSLLMSVSFRTLGGNQPNQGPSSGY